MFVVTFYSGRPVIFAVNGKYKKSSVNTNVPVAKFTNDNKIVAIYSLSGIRQRSLQKGINIVKMSDGTVRKIIVK